MMNKAFKVAICGLLIVAVAIPAIAGGPPSSKAKSAVSNVGKSVYQGGATVLEGAEGLFSGCLRTTFSLFNPCMDAIKGCSTIVFAPIEKPLDYLERAYYKPRKAAVLRVPEPKKPDMPK
jgi:hypothetical protein